MVRSGTNTLRYKISDFDFQVFEPTAGAPYRTIAFEEPSFLDAKRIRVARYPIRSLSDVTIQLDGVTDNTLIDQVDLNNGIIFLSRTLSTNAFVNVSYVYEDKSYTCDGINLNPTLRHNPDILGKYVGLYIIPNMIFRTFTTETFQRTVFTMTRDTADEIVIEVPTLKLSDGTSAHALLLGIYHVVQSEDPDDITVIDTRTPGGGLRSDIAPIDVDQDEVRFYGDIGGHFDGEPFPDAGTLIVEIPDTIPGTGEADCRVTIFDSIGSTGLIDASGWINPTAVLTRDEIHESIKKHAEAGAYVVEDYYA